MDPLDHARLLLRKAAHDEFVLKLLLASPESPDEAIGFHARQAIEKMLKAALAFSGIGYPWRHDLVELIDLLKQSGVDFPAALEDVRRLNPFAVELRYDELPEAQAEPLDRAWARECVHRVRQWAESVIRQ